MNESRWFSGNYLTVEFQMTLEQAQSISHQGQCDSDVLALSRVPAIASQLEAINPESLRRELEEYGAWNENELSDHDQNLQRILWLAAGNIVDQNYSEVSE